MRKGFKERIAFEVLMILGALARICLITRLWPLLFLVILGILIAALRLLFVSARKKTEEPAPIVIPREPLRPDTEQDVIRIAFGVMQNRVSENISSRYPSARWVWDAPNPIERFADNLPLTIMLNRCGGYRKALVSVCSLQFRGIIYETADAAMPDEPPPGYDEDGGPGFEGMPDSDEPIDYALIAFQWVEANLLTLNRLCNEAVASSEESLVIPNHSLPHPDSWPDVCHELTRNGFTGAKCHDHGISVKIPI